MGGRPDAAAGPSVVPKLGAVFRACQGEVGDRASDAAIAIGERVDRHEPEMGKSGLDHRIDVRAGAVLIEPV